MNATPLWLLAIACSPGTTEPQEPAGRLLIEEVYYAGAVPAAGVERYYSDQFIQLVNASEDTVAVGGLMIGNAAGVAGEINAGTLPDSYRSERPNRVILENVWRVPGAPEDVLVEPGESLLLAHDGTNHQPMSTVDLTGADFETFVQINDGDEDHPLVDNLEPVHFTGGYDWLITVFGPSVVVLGADTELNDVQGEFNQLKGAPVTSVIDGVDALMDRSSADFKRLPDVVDSGFTSVGATYNGQSVKRVRTDDGWSDTNNSSVDFERGEPEPYLP